jgi:putative spermidine/putrescine transport system substrate-binding protein
LWRRLPVLALLLSLAVSGTMLGCAARDGGQDGDETGTPFEWATETPSPEDMSAVQGRGGGAAAADEATAPPTELPADATATARAAIVFGADRAPIGPPAAPGWEGQDWPDVLLKATGTTVRWAMWAGDPRINDWVDDYVADVAAGRLGIGLEVVPLNDTVDAVNRIATDKAADLEAGSIDLLWVNGENFHTLRQGDLLYGPWAQWTPASTYLDWQDLSWQLDLGVPVEGYEMPWGRAILVLIHDSARLNEPPDTLEALLAWIGDNPGRFTYPAPPDFTGSAFVRQVCAALTPRPELLLRPASEVSEADIAAALAPCWAALGDVAPSLWREGSTYPASLAQQNDLFANGEIDLDLNYNPAAASGFIADGRYPETTRTFVLRDGMLANTHYLAIPWNAPNKAGAMVLADLLGQPAAQLAKAQPYVWGDLPVVDPERLGEAWRIALDELPLGPATLPLEQLIAVRRPEPHASWVSVIEQGWAREVLGR